MRRTTIDAEGAQRWIGVTAASTLINPELLEKALPRFARWGYAVRTDDSLLEKFRYFAGTDHCRSQAIMRLLKDPSVGAIWCARGGYGATRLLQQLDKLGAPKAMNADPKLLLGYSDATALHLYFYHHNRVPSVHCQMPATPKWLKMSKSSDQTLQAILAGKMPTGKKSHTASWPLKTFYSTGKATEGVILGGNLTLLVNMIGTPWQPDLRGALLFIEDCGEAPYRVDRMLTQLENSGMLKNLSGVLIGDFESDVKYREPAEKKYWKGIFEERFAGRGFPVLSKLPVGHGKKNEPLPLGVRGEITSDGKLILLEQPVKS
jgi:muramoyltetrapeptide carboxypeptidase